MRDTAKVILERRLEPASEIMLHVSLREKSANLGWYRYDDSDNLGEVASILRDYLDGEGFRGNVQLFSKDSPLGELFVSDLRERYDHGRVELGK